MVRRRNPDIVASPKISLVVREAYAAPPSTAKPDTLMTPDDSTPGLVECNSRSASSFFLRNHSMTQDLTAARRDFLKNCGKFAALTPPTVVLLLSASEHNYAAAASGGFVSPFQSNVQQGINTAPGLTGTNAP
jgi:hypothetical protein